MSKESGWARWTRRYAKKNRRGRDLKLPLRSLDDLYEFADKSRGPIQVALWDQDLVGFNERGFAVDKQRVKQAAEYLQRGSKDASYPKQYLIGDVYEQAKAAGETISKKTAERRFNQEFAAKAKAVRLAAKLGQVDLTAAQQKRLREIERGRFLDLIYGRGYKSGDRGTLEYGLKKRGARGNEADQARADELRAYTYEIRNSRAA